MRGHSWAKITDSRIETWPGSLRDSLPEMYKDVEPQYENRRRWQCRRCFVILEARAGEKQCHARHRAKIPHDCDLLIVRSVITS